MTSLNCSDSPLAAVLDWCNVWLVWLPLAPRSCEETDCFGDGLACEHPRSGKMPARTPAIAILGRTPRV
jgi:hypothetical protein